MVSVTSGELRVACLATQGPGSQDEQRIVELLAPLSPSVWSPDRDHRLRSALKLWRRLRKLAPDIVVMEGTGIAGGVPLLLSRLTGGPPFVVSSGDAVGPFLGLLHAWLRWPGTVYEVSLCRASAGYIGWSPYLAGRALTFGAARAMTAANWAPELSTAGGAGVRERLGIPDDALVFGLVGSLVWNPRRAYVYGLELVQAVRDLEREDVRVLVVGDGDGLAHLRHAAGSALGRSVLLPGRVAREDVGAYLGAMDVASLPQSVDRVGAFRYTTKLSEYLAAGVPVVTGELPLAYDLDDGWVWRLPGEAPWDPRYLDALSGLMRGLTRSQARERRPRSTRSDLFSAADQQRRVCAFVREAAARSRLRAQGRAAQR